MELTAEQEEKVQTKEQPTWVEPTLAKLTDDYFSDPDWVFERKLDGVRCLVFKKGDDVKLRSRNQKSQNEIYPELIDALQNVEGDFIADGEVVTFKDKITSFSELQARINKKKPSDDLLKKVPVFYYLFDLMHINGKDVSDLDLKSRKNILREKISFQDPIRYCQHINEKGKEFLEEACEKGWEGIIAKNAKKAYINGRTSHWLKFKCANRQEFIIGGFTDPKGERIGFGALLIGFYEDDQLKYAGMVGTGYSDEQLEDMRGKMDELEQDESPFDEKVDEKGVHYIKPELVAEIGFTEWTSHDKLRHPRFLGLRHDKDPKDVNKEQPS